MARRIVHFGPDYAHRLMVLRSAGYAIDDCESFNTLERAFEIEPHADAVAVTETHALYDGQAREHVISLVRASSRAPLILFQSRERHYLESEFDLVVPVLTSPHQWLSDIQGLIARSQALRDQSEWLRERSTIIRQQAAAARDLSQLQRERSRRERERNAASASGTPIFFAASRPWSTARTNRKTDPGPQRSARESEGAAAFRLLNSAQSICLALAAGSLKSIYMASTRVLLHVL